MPGSQLYMHARTVVAIGVVVCLAVAACASKGSGTGSLGSVTGGPAPASAIPSGGPSSPPSGPSSTGSPSSGSQSGGGQSGSGTTLKVTEVLDLTAPAVVVTADCPYHYTLHGTVTVNKGPVDLKYQWRYRGGEEPAVPQVMHFGGTGPQSKVVTLLPEAAVYDQDIGTQLVIFDKNGVVIVSKTRTFHLTCGVQLGVAPQPLNPPAHCPYTTDFNETINAIVPQTVTYEWILGDGTVVPGQIYASAATLITIPNVNVTAMGLTGTYHITFKITSPGGGTTTETVQCPGVNK